MKILPQVPQTSNPSPDELQALYRHKQECFERWFDWYNLNAKWNLPDDAEAFEEKLALDQEKLKELAIQYYLDNKKVIDKRADDAKQARIYENVLGVDGEFTGFGRRESAGLSLEHLNDESSFDYQDAKELKRLFSYTAPELISKNYVTFKVGAQDVVVKSSMTNQSSYVHKTVKRGKIKVLTRQAVQRMKLHFRNVDQTAYKAMLTLTYPEKFTNDGKRVKEHRKLMVKWLLRHGVNGLSWFLEFQKRGAPHFHIYLTNYPVGGVEAVSKHWFKVVGSGDEKHLQWHLGKLSGRPCLEMFRNAHAASAYATKYATKQEQKEVPEDYQNVGRFWGCSGGVRPVWSYLTGYNYHSVSQAVYMIMHWRMNFQGVDDAQRWGRRAFASCVMWQGAKVFDHYLAAYEWTPF